VQVVGDQAGTSTRVRGAEDVPDVGQRHVELAQAVDDLGGRDLGHASATITLAVHQHVHRGMGREAADRFAALRPRWTAGP
jgi:hypothetical protein